MQGLIVFFEVVALLSLSAACSGLNVAFMSLDLADVRRKAKLGNGNARKVLPLLRSRHLTLAAILLTNVAAVSATSLVLESLTGGLIAGLLTTLLVVTFGEILPQAYFARKALILCGQLVPAMRTMIVVTYFAAKPIQLMLDNLFGKETAKLHSRQELGVIINEHIGNSSSELDDDEVEIIRGALQLSEKRVSDIMQPIDKVYWLTPDVTVDQYKIEEIKHTGRSRIPICNKRLTACYGILLIKDLVDINFDDSPTPIDELPLYPTQTVGDRTALDTLFRKFIRSGGHLIPVERDDTIVGIVTIEDLLEEIVGREIEDETDRRTKHLRRFARRKKK
jgi:metal transporter CNNM